MPSTSMIVLHDIISPAAGHPSSRATGRWSICDLWTRRMHMGPLFCFLCPIPTPFHRILCVGVIVSHLRVVRFYQILSELFFPSPPLLHRNCSARSQWVLLDLKRPVRDRSGHLHRTSQLQVRQPPVRDRSGHCRTSTGSASARFRVYRTSTHNHNHKHSHKHTTTRTQPNQNHTVTNTQPQTHKHKYKTTTHTQNHNT